MAAMLVGM
jgi:hypothetical protein